LKSEVVARANEGDLEAVLARLQWGKNDVGYSLHVNPSSFSLAGLQKTDFLAYLGFQRSDKCTFTQFKRCFVRWVNEGFDVQLFVSSFNRAFERLVAAQNGLEACGFVLPQPEGWGFFNGRAATRRSGPRSLSGDGHMAQTVQSMKSTEDDTFLFKFSFIDTGREKGFVTHYRPKHPPLSPELQSVFKYLGLRLFDECPEFDFEPCHYRTLPFESRGNSVFDSNTEYAHRGFDAHAPRLSGAIKSLLEANAEIEKTGLVFLPFEKPAERMRQEIRSTIALAPKPAANTVAKGAKAGDPLPDRFDVAVSFAGTERALAEQLARAIRDAGYAVFYDNFYPEHLWGKNLATFFDEIFRKRARFCVMFVSKEYRDRKWTSHEARSAQARALEAKGNEYILPIKIDGTELDGLPPIIGYVPISLGIDKISETLVKKLQQ
jgi:hypothetical protein